MILALFVAFLSPIPVCIHSSAEMFRPEIISAVAMWNGDVEFMRVKACDSDTPGVITISVGRATPYYAWTWAPWMPEPLARDIVLSDVHPWVSVGSRQTERIIAHELGHALGLMHSSVDLSVMHDPPGIGVLPNDLEAARAAFRP